MEPEARPVAMLTHQALDARLVDSLYSGAIKLIRAAWILRPDADGRILRRQALEALLPLPEVERWMETARVERTTWMHDEVPMERRRPLLLQALAGLYKDQTP